MSDARLAELKAQLLKSQQETAQTQQQLAEATSSGNASRAQLARQLNLLKRKNRDLRIEILDIPTQSPPKPPNPEPSPPKQRVDPQKKAQPTPQISNTYPPQQGGKSPYPSAPYPAPTSQTPPPLQANTNHHPQQIQPKQYYAASAQIQTPLKTTAEHSLYDPVITSLENHLHQLREERQRSGTSNVNKNQAQTGSPSHETEKLQGQIRELEQENRARERDVAKLQDALHNKKDAPGNVEANTQYQQLKRELEHSRKEKQAFQKAHQELEATLAGSGGSRGEVAKQMNQLKRNNRDLRMQLQHTGETGSAALEAQITELKVKLSQTSATSQPNASSNSAHLNRELETFQSAFGEKVDQWRGDLRSLGNHANNLREFFEAFLSGRQSRIDDALDMIDPETLVDDLERMAKEHQNIARELKSQLEKFTTNK